jgi:transposase
MGNPLIKQQEEYNKIADLAALIKSNPDPRELKRALAVKMSIEGHPEQIIAQLLGISKSFIRDWKKAFKIEGIARITVSRVLDVKIEQLEDLENLNDTKDILENAIARSTYLNSEVSNQRPLQIRWKLAFQIDLNIIKTYCPDGYAAFT